MAGKKRRRRCSARHRSHLDHHHGKGRQVPVGSIDLKMLPDEPTAKAVSLALVRVLGAASVGKKRSDSGAGLMELVVARWRQFPSECRRRCWSRAEMEKVVLLMTVEPRDGVVEAAFAVLAFGRRQRIVNAGRPAFFLERGENASFVEMTRTWQSQRLSLSICRYCC